jgi:hypothetical protein
MLLEELSKNKKAGLIIVALGVIYIISKRFLFRTILGRLLLVVGLVATTKCNKALGLGLVLLICLAYSQISNDFENMDTMDQKPRPDTNAETKTDATSTESKSKPKSLPLSTPDMATIAENMRDIIKGVNSSSLPIAPKSSSKDVPGVSEKTESFLNYAPFNHS